MSVSSSSSFSSLKGSIQFRFPTQKERSSLLAVAKCAVSGSARWSNRIITNPPHYIYHPNTPCIAEFEGSYIFVHWSVLQLMRLYDLSFQGYKVDQTFPSRTFKVAPKDYLAKATHAIVHSIDTSTLKNHFQIKERIKQKYPNLGLKSCKNFFNQYRGKDARAVFRSIFNIQIAAQTLLSNFSALRTVSCSVKQGKETLDDLASFACLELGSSLDESSSSSSSSTDVLSRETTTIKLGTIYHENTQKLMIKVFQDSYSPTISINVHKVLHKIPTNIIRDYLTDIDFHPLDTSEESDNLVFRPLSHHEWHLVEFEKCAITGTKQWNLDSGHSNTGKLPIAYPCIAQFNGSYILIYWAVLQLMVIHNLKFKGRSVTQIQITPTFNGDPTRWLVKAIADSRLKNDFDIKAGIQRQSRYYGIGNNYRKFFQLYKGVDAEVFFKSILLKKISSISRERLSYFSRIDNEDRTIMVSHSSNLPQLPVAERSEGLSSVLVSSSFSDDNGTIVGQVRLLCDTQSHFNICLDHSHKRLTIPLGYQGVLGKIPPFIMQDHLSKREEFIA